MKEVVYYALDDKGQNVRFESLKEMQAAQEEWGCAGGEITHCPETGAYCCEDLEPDTWRKFATADAAIAYYDAQWK